MPLKAPILQSIDPEMLLFGRVHLEWSAVEGATSYLLYRDFDPIEDVTGWNAYSIIQTGLNYEDLNYENNVSYFYAVKACAGNENERSHLSNTERIDIHLPPNLQINSTKIRDEAYLKSLQPTKINDKIWQLARLQLILEQTFPQRTLEYLKIKFKSIKRDLPEFNGLFVQPSEAQIRERAQQIYYDKLDKMILDWRVSEKELIVKKIEELLEFEMIER